MRNITNNQNFVLFNKETGEVMDSANVVAMHFEDMPNNGFDMTFSEKQNAAAEFGTDLFTINL